uniref:Uncharacterized protein n=1 Tax=Pyricularia oryzae (strain P131) TaxID=1143193 RepID=L7JJU3_PYRO1
MARKRGDAGGSNLRSLHMCQPPPPLNLPELRRGLAALQIRRRWRTNPPATVPKSPPEHGAYDRGRNGHERDKGLSVPPDIDDKNARRRRDGDGAADDSGRHDK